MAQCEVCGNEYDKSFEVILAGQRHVFDSFECAANALAPRCAHCGCRILGHGLEADGNGGLGSEGSRLIEAAGTNPAQRQKLRPTATKPRCRPSRRQGFAARLAIVAVVEQDGSARPHPSPTRWRSRATHFAIPATGCAALRWSPCFRRRPLLPRPSTS
jgi:hypothetical protein